MQALRKFLEQVGSWIAAHDQTDQMFVSISLCLLFAAGPLIRWLDNGRSDSQRLRTRIRTTRILNLAIIGTCLAHAILLDSWYVPWIRKTTGVLITIYFAIVLNQVLSFVIQRRFGRVKEIEGARRVIPTYASHALSLMCSIGIVLLTMVISLQLIGLESLLQTGGVLGIIGIFLALAQNAWAPDLFSGLIILNSRLCDEGDVIQLNVDGKTIATVFKTKFFHTELLDLTNNHRLMVRNTLLRDCVVHNLSRFASARGLRERLDFNIGYDCRPDAVRKMFDAAFEEIDRKSEIREEQHSPHYAVVETGDYAVKWAVFYYIKDVKSILAFRQLVQEEILVASLAHEIALATPILHQTSE